MSKPTRLEQLEELARTGKRMREYQIKWYRHHNPPDLGEAKRLESLYDRLLRDLESTETQSKLF